MVQYSIFNSMESQTLLKGIIELFSFRRKSNIQIKNNKSNNNNNNFQELHSESLYFESLQKTIATACEKWQEKTQLLKT